MAAPHNTKRYGERWNSEDLDALLTEIECVKDLGVVSGGWAWHFMSPPHEELKHAHDHKDVDIFVPPDKVWMMAQRLGERGYERAWTRFDGESDDFHRYVRTIEAERPLKVIFDVFTGDVLSVAAPSGVTVVDPAYLLTLYGVKHSSGQCFSVQIARSLIARGISPVGRPEMADFSRFLKAA